jgi:hypothetical protein
MRFAIGKVPFACQTKWLRIKSGLGWSHNQGRFFSFEIGLNLNEHLSKQTSNHFHKNLQDHCGRYYEPRVYGAFFASRT